jgi:hypothetical protein
VIAAWATFGTRNYAGSWAWRVPSLLQVLLPIIGIPGLIMIPESPRWLVSVDRVDEACQNLANIHVGGDTTHPLIEFEMAEIQQTIKAEKEAEQFSAWNDLWATPGNRHRLFISLSLGIFSQWAGNGVVSYYLSIILNSVGITSVDDQTLISACLQVWNLIWAVTAALLVERLGRRLLFMTSVSACCCKFVDCVPENSLLTNSPSKAVVMLVSYIIITGLSGSFASTGDSATGLAVIPFLFM